MKYTACLLLILGVAFFSACRDESVINYTDPDFKKATETLDIGILPLDYNTPLLGFLKTAGMADVHLDNAKAELGRVLFYDNNLSKDGKISCASCHKQELAFSDDKAFSEGVFGRITARNSSALGNTAHFGSNLRPYFNMPIGLFWDERANDVSRQAEETFHNALEMDMSMDEVVQQVQRLPYYPYLLRQAYGDSQPTPERLLESIEMFVNSIASRGSKFDKSMEQSVDFTTNTVVVNITSVSTVYYNPIETTDTIVLIKDFTIDEALGMDLFIKNCSFCHSPVRTLQNISLACNGLELDYTDEGLGAITGRPEDKGVFKSPPLRNIALTAPYMHDGRFKTLEEVIEFYNTGVKNHPNLHQLIRRPNLQTPMFNATQKNQLLAFLHTLTDPNLKDDPRYASPFK